MRAHRRHLARLAVAAIVICGMYRGASAEPGAPPVDSAIPPHNRADQREPPPRPPASDAAAKAQQLFAAIVANRPELADSVFFPRDAFNLVKDIRDPGKYYDRLKRRFVQDIHDLHARLPDAAHAKFERFELANRGGFVRVHEEGNRLPYWAARHSFIHYRTAGRTERLEVRVLISWDDRWYVIHLNEFRTGPLAGEASSPRSEAKVTSR